ncbi:MAG: helicase [Nevskia sp.]|nr:helicase [Nevskia sp.]
MATLVPARNACLSRMTSGERRFSERLEKKLEDDYLCWFDVPIGPKQLRPDFVIVHPQRGVLVLEVKDWKLEHIQQIDRQSCRLLTERGLVSVPHPLEQARMYAMQIEVQLRQDAALRNPQSHRYAGKLVAPWGFGVVLANITRAQFDEKGLGQVLEPGHVICQDEMLDHVDAERFQQRLWAMFTQVFACKLTLPQLDRIRWHLFPEIRVNPQTNQFGLFGSSTTAAANLGTEPSKTAPIAIPDLIKVMDLNQELLARSMGDGHRVIHGVAGSGKTMILGYRCLKLARELSKPILVLCFNVALAARLRQMMLGYDLGEQVVVLHFHDWCRAMLTAFNVDRPQWTPDINAYSEDLVLRTIAGVDSGQIPRAQYGAVMIDEGHDFQPEWFKLVVQMVDPVSNAMLVLYDDAQAIYSPKQKGGERRKFSFASVGVQARGRTTILKLNYRNTLEVLAVARAFASELLDAQNADDDGVPLISPESAGRRGPLPELIRAKSHHAEAIVIADHIRDAHQRGRDLSDIAIVYRKDQWVANLEEQLTRRGIPFRSANGPDKKRTLFEGEPAVKLVSMHSSKGLEFHTVFIPGLDRLPDTREPEESEARLLYVAMTRATDRLVMTCGREGGFVERVASAVNGVRAQLAA